MLNTNLSSSKKDRKYFIWHNWCILHDEQNEIYIDYIKYGNTNLKVLANIFSHFTWLSMLTFEVYVAIFDKVYVSVHWSLFNFKLRVNYILTCSYSKWLCCCKRFYTNIPLKPFGINLNFIHFFGAWKFWFLCIDKNNWNIFLKDIYIFFSSSVFLFVYLSL